MRDRSIRSGPMFWLTLEANDPTRVGAIWTAVATVTVLFQKKLAPDPPREIVFTLNGAEEFRGETDNEGKVSCDLNFPNPGSYRLTAYISDMPAIRASRAFLIKPETTKPQQKPADLDVDVTGKLGEQKVIVSVGTEDGQLIPNFAGTLSDGTELVAFKTDERGIFSYQTKLDTGEKRVVRVIVGVSEVLQWTGVLSGKRR